MRNKNTPLRPPLLRSILLITSGNQKTSTRTHYTQQEWRVAKFLLIHRMLRRVDLQRRWKNERSDVKIIKHGRNWISLEERKQHWRDFGPYARTRPSSFYYVVYPSYQLKFCDQQRYELFVPLHELWLGYMSELLSLPPRPSDDTVVPVLPNSSTIHPKLVKADFHGSIITGM